ncbi:MAG: TetR/AcrR family transcriptional regulator, partial [Agromyces sp.]
MAHRARSHAPRADFAPSFWAERGFGEHPTNREKFLALTIDEVSKTGPHSFNATLICDLLGATYPMVNHYFGNRNGLVAEAVAVAYRQYIQSLRVAAEIGDTPADRLASWAWQQINWTTEHAGISVVLDFPESSLEVTTILREQFGAEMAELFEF